MKCFEKIKPEELQKLLEDVKNRGLDPKFKALVEPISKPFSMSSIIKDRNINTFDIENYLFRSYEYSSFI